MSRFGHKPLRLCETGGVQGRRYLGCGGRVPQIGGRLLAATISERRLRRTLSVRRCEAPETSIPTGRPV